MVHYDFMSIAQLYKVLIETNLAIKQVKESNRYPIPLDILEDRKQELEYFLSKLTHT